MSTRSRRYRRYRGHRADTTWGALGITVGSALLPGTGFVVAGRRRLGFAVLAPYLLLLVVLGWFVATRRRQLLTMAVDPQSLLLISALLVVVLLAWVTVLVATYEMLRPLAAPGWQRAAGLVCVGLLALVVAVPLAVSARYAYVQRDLVNNVFRADGQSATRPTVGSVEEDPWGDDDRVNLLLLGGDGGVERLGIRTDSVIVASLDTETGDTALFSLPRNLEDVPFPAGSPVAEIYPDGFHGGPSDDELDYMLNAVYRNVPQWHPGVIENTDNPGADALKLAVGAALGIELDYYVLVNLRGFEQVVDAMGGVTVNINQPIPVGGNTDLGVPPDDYLEPGPDQHLTGFEALWFARGRYGLDDYDRMERQRCVVDALLDRVEPVTLLRRYEQLAQAGKEIVRTDIPQQMLPAFVELVLELKSGDVRSVVFQSSERFDPGDPDYDFVQQTVQRALGEAPKPTPATPSPGAPPSPTPTPGPADEPVVERAADSCAYDPVG